MSRILIKLLSILFYLFCGMYVLLLTYYVSVTGASPNHILTGVFPALYLSIGFGIVVILVEFMKGLYNIGLFKDAPWYEKLRDLASFKSLYPDKNVKIFSQGVSSITDTPIKKELYAADLAGHVLMLLLLKLPVTITEHNNTRHRLSYPRPIAESLLTTLKHDCFIHYAGLVSRRLLFDAITVKHPKWKFENRMDQPVYLQDEHVFDYDYIMTLYAAASLPELIKVAGPIDMESTIRTLSGEIYGQVSEILQNNKDALLSLYAFFLSKPVTQTRISEWADKNQSLLLFPDESYTDSDPADNTAK